MRRNTYKYRCKWGGIHKYRCKWGGIHKYRCRWGGIYKYISIHISIDVNEEEYIGIDVSVDVDEEGYISIDVSIDVIEACSNPLYHWTLCIEVYRCMLRWTFSPGEIHEWWSIYVKWGEMHTCRCKWGEVHTCVFLCVYACVCLCVCVYSYIHLIDPHILQHTFLYSSKRTHSIVVREHIL